MTASLHKLGAGREAGLYYTNDSRQEAKPSRRDEYYTRGGDGVWWSSGETVVRTGAAIDLDSFRDLCAGVDPSSGKPLVRGAGQGHWAGLDATMTPGKSVSVLWMSGTPEQRQIVETAHLHAVDRALKFILDEGLIMVRRGAGGVEKALPSDLVAAKFTHYTTREGDPNIHTHCVILNVAGAPKHGAPSRYGFRHLTIEPEKLFSYQLVLGAAYRAALSERLSVAGLTPRPAGRGQWELEGLPQDLLELFSKRSHQIENSVGRDASAAQKEIAALRTRSAKDDVPTGEELEQRWRQELSQTGIAPWQAVRRTSPELSEPVDTSLDQKTDRELFDPPEIPGTNAVAIAASALFRTESVIDRRSLLERALVQAALQRRGPEAVYAQLASLEASGQLLRLAEGIWTTRAIAAVEAAMLLAADRPQERQWFDHDALEAALKDAPHLSPEQREAVVETARPDGVSVVEAGAGTGKTTLARVIVDAAHRSGLKVLGLAPSWVTADELSKSTEIRSVAIARWRYDIDRGGAIPLDAATVIIVDESGMVGTRDLSAILVKARDAKAKVVLIGDRRQLEPVPGASALKGVAEVVRRGAILEGIRRQKVEWQRAASVAMARGDTESGLRAYATRDRLELVAGEIAARGHVIEKWKELRKTHGPDVLIVTRRNQDSQALNQSARQVLRDERLITGQDIKVDALNREDKSVTLALARGDQIRFSENLPGLGIRNGSRAKIEGVHRDENGEVRIDFMLEDGRRITGDWRSFARQRPSGKTLAPRVVHAYAGTVYSVQGRTAAATVVYVGRQTDAREIYVALTRHTQDAYLVVESHRLEARCRLRQIDHRMMPTSTSMRERLFREASQYREKANVADYCADRTDFAHTGQVALQTQETTADNVARAVLAARRLREAMTWLDPTRIRMPFWRAIELGRELARMLPEKLSALVVTLRERGTRARDNLSRFPSHDR